jgi:hypothetical protein
MNKVVAHFADGRVVKGFTNDFFPDKALFHVNLDAATPHAKAEGYRTSELKALYFVKDFTGNPQHDERREFDQSQRAIGRKIRVVFKDGEEMVGTTQGYQPGRPGFFLVPADPASNIDRCYVVSSETKSIAFI